MKTAFAILVIFHGMIHLAGYSRVLNFEPADQLAQNISRTNSMLWLSVSILFFVTALAFLLSKDSWWMISFVAIVLSQYLVFANWHSAMLGTIANLIIFVATIIACGTWSFHNKYRDEVSKSLTQAISIPDSLLTEADIRDLPGPVKKYLHYTGAIGKPKINYFKVEFAGQIRKNEKSEWMPFTSEQYNFMETSTRLFFMKATMKYLPVAGFHSFKDGDAFMDIRLLSLFKVQYQSGKEMGIAETVTFFNDMCCMAPATLIDKRIRWLETAGNKVKAEFTNNKISICAWLQFNDRGELINFISDDRYTAENNNMKRSRWSTPMKEYKIIKGHKLAGYAETIYSYPEGNLCYGNFRLLNIDYNGR